MSVRTDPLSDSVDVDPDVSRYDILLAVLPLRLLLGAAIGQFSATPMHIGVSLGSVPSAFLIWYGLFFDAPIQPDE